MSNKELYTILEMEPTDNIKDIKRAYAMAIRKYHPEENPEEWKRVHDAYTQLIDYYEKRNISCQEQLDIISGPEQYKTVLIEKSSEITIIQDSENLDDSKNTEDFRDAEEFEDIGKIAQQSEIKYKKDLELKNKLQQSDVDAQNKYFELLQNIKGAFSIKGTRGGRSLIADMEYSKVRNMPLFFDALEDKEFAEAYTYVVKNCIIEDIAAPKMIRDLEYVGQDNPKCLLCYSKLIAYIKDEKNLYSSGALKNKKNDILCAAVCGIAVVILICICVKISKKSTNNDYRPNTYSFEYNDNSEKRQKLSDESNIELYGAMYDMMGHDEFVEFMKEQGFSSQEISLFISRRTIENMNKMDKIETGEE